MKNLLVALTLILCGFGQNIYSKTKAKKSVVKKQKVTKVNKVNKCSPKKFGPGDCECQEPPPEDTPDGVTWVYVNGTCHQRFQGDCEGSCRFVNAADPTNQSLWRHSYCYEDEDELNNDICTCGPALPGEVIYRPESCDGPAPADTCQGTCWWRPSGQEYDPATIVTTLCNITT